MRLSRNLLVPVYTIAIFGSLLYGVGGTWDISFHILGLVETFFTPPHLVLYTGIALMFLAGVWGLLMRLTIFREKAERPLLAGLNIVLVGTVIQLFAGAFDFWWHSTFGFDPFLFTPSHSMLIIGGIASRFGLAIGSVRLLLAYRAKLNLGRFFFSSKWLQLLVVVALATLWGGLNSFVYLISDLNGMAYTFQLSKDFVDQNLPLAFSASEVALAATGTLIFLTAKTILGWRGGVTAIALLLASVRATADLGFRASVLGGSGGISGVTGSATASFIPLYFSFLVPIFLFDLLIENTGANWTRILGGALIAPFVSYLDGFYSLILWTRLRELIPILIVPMVLAGLIAGLSRIRFVNVFLSQKMVALKPDQG